MADLRTIKGRRWLFVEEPAHFNMRVVMELTGNDDYFQSKSQTTTKPSKADSDVNVS